MPPTPEKTSSPARPIRASRIIYCAGLSHIAAADFPGLCQQPDHRPKLRERVADHSLRAEYLTRARETLRGQTGDGDALQHYRCARPRSSIAIPLHGTYIGFASDHLDMEVRVSVMSDAPKEFRVAPGPSTRRRFAQSA